jgi:ATP-dependent DNA helicase RecG
VGPKLAKIFARLGVVTVEDLFYLLPRSYEDRRNIKPIVKIRPSDFEVIKGEVLAIRQQQTRGRFHILKVILSDKTASIQAVWFNQPYLVKLFRKGMKLIVSGKIDFSKYEGALQLIVRNFEVDTGENLKIVPRYPLTEGLYPKKIRSVMKTALDNYLKYVEDPSEKSALLTLHLPDELDRIEAARARLAYEELFIFQLGMLLRRKSYKEELKGIAYQVKDDVVHKFKAALPFQLTPAQDKVLSEIFSDLKSERPMNRLLQGDVGSGKTVIAALAAYVVIQNGYQAAILAPTEILAQQHFAKVRNFIKEKQIMIKLVTAAANRKEKFSGELNEDLIIGTHALIEEKVRFRKLGLVIIDEQHRFGVEQRARLVKKGFSPDVLVMTATPIPRSLALTLYGDLDKSIIDALPPGRLPVKTYFVPDKRRRDAYEFIRSKVKGGAQVYVVCPLVMETEESDLKAATAEAQRLQNEIFPELKIGLLHGRMKSEEKGEIMRKFKEKEIHLLVATTVIEVGIDIPEATIMLIEHAERFGLSQLHQLRGRIGRAGEQSFCFLVGGPKTEEARARLRAMLETGDGFKIAEADLKLRGPGDFWGVRQSGLPNFRVADIIRDEKIIQKARTAAEEFIAKDSEGARNRWESQRHKVEFSASKPGHPAFN